MDPMYFRYMDLLANSGPCMLSRDASWGEERVVAFEVEVHSATVSHTRIMYNFQSFLARSLSGNLLRLV